jgi:hypothetical protein
MYMIIGSNPGRVQIFFIVSCTHYVVVLEYTKNYYTKVMYFRRSIAMHQCMTL